MSELMSEGSSISGHDIYLGSSTREKQRESGFQTPQLSSSQAAETKTNNKNEQEESKST